MSTSQASKAPSVDTKHRLQSGGETFPPWRRQDGKVFTTTCAFDTETTLIDEARPWLTPAYVLGAAYDGNQGFFVERQSLRDFLYAHDGVPFIMHNASFDLAVLHSVVPEFDIYRWVDQHQVWDTRLLHRLLALGSTGRTAGGSGESTLEACAEAYLQIELSKDVVDSKGRPVRLSYSRWLGRPFSEIEAVYLEYLAKDVMITHALYGKLQHALDGLLNDSHNTWGFVSPAWLNEQICRWGPQTHHIQLKADVVLHEITAAGLHIDLSRRKDLTHTLEEVRDERLQELRSAGYLPGKGSRKALQSILTRLERQHPDLEFLKTPTGKYTTSAEALSELTTTEPFIKSLLEYQENQKLLSTFVERMGRGVLHPSFNVLARTGRTSSFGDINAQNLPRDDRIRHCIVPSQGHVFLNLDYKTLEMATLAQAVQSQFGLDSQMARAINAGQDLHRDVAAQFTGKRLTDVTKDDRQKAKPVNFGKPGGMGNAALKQYAQSSYRVALSDLDVENLSQAWLTCYPEMVEFLSDQTDLGAEIATLLGLTPQDHFEVTGSRKFVGHPANEGRETLPHAILGAMSLKTFKLEEPTTNAGHPYNPAMIEYFWGKLAAKVGLLPKELQFDALHRRPSVRLQRAIMRLVGRAGVFTLTGRLRANATYSARHNTVFQALAADGAKLALWEVWRAGYRIVNFIHDELLVEVPQESNLALSAAIVQQLMIRGMRQVVPDIRIDVDYVVADRWSKAAHQIWDERGCLIPWHPSTAN